MSHIYELNSSNKMGMINGLITAVITADKTNANELKAPCSMLTGVIVAVPNAWLAHPIPNPCAFGQLTPTKFKKRNPKTPPIIPATIIPTAVIAAIPLRSSAKANPIGVVTDFNANDTATSVELSIISVIDILTTNMMQIEVIKVVNIIGALDRIV